MTSSQILRLNFSSINCNIVCNGRKKKDCMKCSVRYEVSLPQSPLDFPQVVWIFHLLDKLKNSTSKWLFFGQNHLDDDLQQHGAGWESIARNKTAWKNKGKINLWNEVYIIKRKVFLTTSWGILNWHSVKHPFRIIVGSSLCVSMAFRRTEIVFCLTRTLSIDRSRSGFFTM